MKIISEIKVKVNGELCVAQVTDEGKAIMPDGTAKLLSEQQYAAILEKVKASVPTNEDARPLTLPDNIYTQEISDENPVSSDTDSPPETEKNVVDESKPTKQNKGQKFSRKHKAPKDLKIVKKTEKSPKNFAVVAIVLALGIVAIVVMFFYATMSGLISLNNRYTTDFVIPPDSTSEPEISPETRSSQATKEDLDEAQTILIVARIITPEGEEKEVVLGYFTTDGENSAIPEIGGGTEVSGNTAITNSILPEDKTSFQHKEDYIVSQIKAKL